MLLVVNRVLPSSGMHHMSRLVMGIPRQGAMRGGALPLTTAQKAMMAAAKVLPQPVLHATDVVGNAAFARKQQPGQGSTSNG